MTRGLGGFTAEEIAHIERRQTDRSRIDVKPKLPPKSRASLTTQDWRRIGQVLTRALEQKR